MKKIQIQLFAGPMWWGLIKCAELAVPGYRPTKQGAGLVIRECLASIPKSRRQEWARALCEAIRRQRRDRSILDGRAA